MSHEDYVLPSRRGRLVWLLAAVVGALMLAFNKLAPSWFEGWLGGNQDIDTGKMLLVAFVTADLLFFAAVCIVMARAGYLTLTKDRWPPLGFPVPFRAKVLVGSGARALGATCFVLAIVMLLGVAFYCYLAWLSYGI